MNKKTMTIKDPNGRVKKVKSGLNWIEVCPVFGIFDGWFERSEQGYDDEVWLLKNGKGVVLISPHQTGIWIGKEGWTEIPGLTKEEAERRLKTLGI